MLDIDKFIDCVRVNPELWDYNNANYANRILKDTRWFSVGENLFPKWNQMTSEKREDLLKEMKGKWRNIRDNYVRFKNHNQSNPTKKKKYVYSEELKFLDNNVARRSRQLCRTDDDEEVEEEEEEEDVKMNFGEQQVHKFEEVLLEADDTYGEDEAMQELAASPPLDSYVAVVRASPQQQAPIKRKVQQPMYVRRQREEVTDPDKAFLYSILPDYRKLSYEQKLDFRMYALGFFKRVNDQNSQSFNGNH